VIFGVFTQIAKGDGFLDLGRQFVRQFVLEPPNFLLELFFDMFRHSIVHGGSLA
jgi:hypothetical protein